MEIRLDYLVLQNFKGISVFVLKPQSKNIVVRGDNATGKTTLKDAFHWVLFGKDSLGRAKFGIQPTDKEGNVIHNITTRVEAVLNVNGKQLSFAKELSEKWTRKRGSSESNLTGTETTYFVDGIPKKKTEYEAQINSLIDEEKFKLITDPFQFNERLEMKDRRKMLIDICGDISDEEILSSDTELLPLREALDGKSVDDFRILLQSKMKPINKELELIPVKINEAKKAKPIVDIDVNNVDMSEIEAQIKAKEEEKASILHGAEITQKRSEISLLEKELFQSGISEELSSTDEYLELEKLKKEIHLLRDVSMLEGNLENNKRFMELNENERKRLSQQWDDVFNEAFENDGLCPTCGQPLPDEKMAEAKNKFNVEKAARLDRLEEKLNVLKENYKVYVSTEEKLKADIVEANQKANELKTKLGYAEKCLHTKNIELQAKQNVKKDELMGKIESLKQEIEKLTNSSKEVVEAINNEIMVLSAKKMDIEYQNVQFKLSKQQDERIKELEEDEKRLSQEYAQLDGLLFLTDQFIKRKVSLLTDKINASFKYASFKLFETQLNEGIKETCEVMYNGVPYKDLNNAMKINIGLDVINTMCRRYDISAPIFTDNAESVTNMFETDSQLIKLVVDGNHKELFVEN